MMIESDNESECAAFEHDAGEGVLEGRREDTSESDDACDEGEGEREWGC